jgi:hypothetical protein
MTPEQKKKSVMFKMLAKMFAMYFLLYLFRLSLPQRMSDSQLVAHDTELRKGLLLTLQASGNQYFVKFHYSWQM